MNLPSRTQILAMLLSTALLSTASAISISSGVVGGSGDVENVLFNQGVDPTGTTVAGTFNSDPSFVVTFTSSTALQVSGGQATLTGLTAPFSDLSFSLASGDTFTKAQLNPDVGAPGTITFTVHYIDGGGSPQVATHPLTATGQNFYTILAQGNEKITGISFTTTTPVLDSGQFRIGGLQHTTSVPDGGSTIGLIGLGLILVAAMKRKLLS